MFKFDIPSPRYIPADAQRQEIRAIRQLNGHQSDALAPATDGEPVAQSGAVHDTDRSAAGDAGPDRPEPEE